MVIHFSDPESHEVDREHERRRQEDVAKRQEERDEGVVGDDDPRALHDDEESNQLPDDHLVQEDHERKPILSKINLINTITHNIKGLSQLALS